MAEPNPESVAAPPADPPASRGRSWVRKLLPVAAVMLVVAVECVIAYSYLPTPAETAAMAQALPGQPPETSPPAAEEHPKAKHGEEHKEAKPDLQEVDLGQFTVTSVQAGTNTTLRIAFHLYGIVSGLDQEQFNTRMKATQHRFREQVILAIRAAELGDLTEPGLGLLKRTILEKTNDTLGAPLLKAIVVSDFSFMEV